VTEGTDAVVVPTFDTGTEAWPGIPTCHAAREDHGTTGAYTAWPALATEALCYIDGNCSGAFEVMATYAPNTYRGAFGQANAVPQLQTAPYTPFNEEPAFKPSDRRYLNMVSVILGNIQHVRNSLTSSLPPHPHLLSSGNPPPPPLLKTFSGTLLPLYRPPLYRPPLYRPPSDCVDEQAVGAFVDAIIRGFFGYHPDMVWPSKFSQQALDRTLLMPGSPRGFTGSLTNVRTPFGLVTITSGPGGLGIKRQQEPSRQ
jgi:hypothetical protein